MKPFTDLKALFPALQQEAHGQPLVYLDNAATTQKPVAVIEAINHYYREYNANVHRASHYLSAKATSAFESAREITRHFINAESTDEIIWTRGATEALNLVAQSWGRSQLKAGDEILLSAMEHHANIVPWQMIAEQTGAEIRVINVLESGELDLKSFREQLSDRTKLLAVTQISNAIGTVNPVEFLTKEAKAVGAVVLIDGSQAVAHTSVDVQKMGCDFYVFSGHKVFGPTGIGVLYGKKNLLNEMPPWQSGGEMIKEVSFSGTSFNSLPFKFEAGTPNIAGVIGLAEALNFVSSMDMKQVAEYEQSLRERAEQKLQAIPGVRLIGTTENKAAVVSFVVDGFHHQDVGLLLDQQGIAVRTGHHCAMPLMNHLGLKGTVRASFTLYNTADDVDRFILALTKVIDHEPVKPVHEEVPDLFAVMPGEKNSDLSRQTIEEALLKSGNWQDKYRQIMLMGKKLPQLPEAFKTDDTRLHGCESNVWLHYFYDQENMTLHFAADSDARVIRGLITIVLSAVNGLRACDIQNLELNTWLDQLGLLNHLSPSRGNGLKAIIAEIHSTAHRYY